MLAGFTVFFVFFVFLVWAWPPHRRKCRGFTVLLPIVHFKKLGKKLTCPTSFNCFTLVEHQSNCSKKLFCAKKITTEAHIEPCQTSMMDIFAKVIAFLAVNYFREKAPSQTSNRILNTPPNDQVLCSITLIFGHISVRCSLRRYLFQIFLITLLHQLRINDQIHKQGHD